ncbi:MAG: radical SAM protein [Candidatus Omnitrophota bacterium]
MKIKLIAPKRLETWDENFWDLRTLSQLTRKYAGGAPLALPSLAALTPNDVEVILTDENVEPVDFDEKVDLVGITGMTCVIPRAYAIADEFRKRRVPVIMGGIHASMVPQEAAQHCDSVVIGEAEDIWKQVIEDAQKGTLQKTYRAPGFPDLTQAPVPRWDLLKNERYCYFTVQTGRGCPFDCEFCSVQKFNGRNYRSRDIDLVLKEISLLKSFDEKRSFFFVDDNLLARKDYAKDLFTRLIEYRIKWWCQASVDSLKDDETLTLMFKSGCREIFVGFESVQQNSLRAMHKTHMNKADEYKDIIAKAHAHGLSIFGSFILGSDSDNSAIFQETRDFIKETNMAFAMINVLTPPPGTALYSRLENEQRLLPCPWNQYDGEHVTFTPHILSLQELREKRIELIKDLYAYKNLYSRLSHLWSKGVFLRERGRKGLFSKGRILFSLLMIFRASWSQTVFTWKCLWRKNATSVITVLLAISFHDYAQRLKAKK